MEDFDGVKVFSATKVKERNALGEVVTEWIRRHPEYQLVDKSITQSSDNEFHCVCIMLFYRKPDGYDDRSAPY